MTDAEKKQKLRPFYSELQGYLSQAPTIKEKPYLYDEEADEWGQVNAIIDQLNNITGINYDRFKISPPGGSGNLSMSLYRTRLGGLISNIHGEFFSDEQAPFSGMPNTVITHNLSQQQSQQQTMTVTLFELRDKIDERLPKVTDEKEKTFLTKMKDQLPTITSVVQLIQTILTLAHQTGLDPNTVSQLLA